MKSPFPGMDPYLEAHWEDVHTALIGYIRDEMQIQLPDDLIARMEEKVYVEADGEVRLRKPDVRVVESPIEWQSSSTSTSTAVLDEPILLELISDPIRQRSVFIYDSARQRIITAIEILSPWNKSPGNVMHAYMEKREKYLDSDTNLVEIDLIRAGDWTQMIAPYFIPKSEITSYRVSIGKIDSMQMIHYRIPLRSKLPTIKIPLRSKDADVVLNLQSLIEKAYRMGRYDRIDYSKPCLPPLDDSDRQWVEGLIAAAERRV